MSSATADLKAAWKRIQEIYNQRGEQNLNGMASDEAPELFEEIWKVLDQSAREVWHGSVAKLGIRILGNAGEMLEKVPLEDRKKFAVPLMPVMMQTIAEAAGIEGDWVNAYRKEELAQAFRILYSLMNQDTVPLQLAAKAATLLEIEKIQLDYDEQFTLEKTKHAFDILTNLHMAEIIKTTANQTGMLEAGIGTNEQIQALLAPPAPADETSEEANGQSVNEDTVEGDYKEASA